MENMSNKEYQKYIEERTPKPTYVKNMVLAFIVGGLICVLGQIILNMLSKHGLDKEQAASGTSILMVFTGSFLTGIGVYDWIGKVGGAGAAIPITGFANSIVSPAMEFKKEGFIFGVASKMFNIAGPVLVYGVGSSVVIGMLYIILTGGG
ncbi:MAG: stage V sporulation protein AC [Tissierellia bacterium]|nr:stage V sporulation protein AC [Tissierellia bacterium]